MGVAAVVNRLPALDLRYPSGSLIMFPVGFDISGCLLSPTAVGTVGRGLKGSNHMAI